MNKRSPNRKRFWVTSWIVLCLAVAFTIGGLYQFYREATQIYEPVPQKVAGQNERQSAGQRVGQSASPERPASDRATPYWQYSQSGTPSGSIKAGQLAPVPTPVVERRVRLQRRAEQKAQKVETFLLLGVDSRKKGEQARADTIILATVPEAGGQVHLLSIPRDTYVSVAGHGYTKINHAMSWGGLPLLKRTVQEFIGVPIDHTVVVDFEGFRKMVDQIGGLDLVAEKAMHYDDPTDGTSIHIAKGQKLRTGQLVLDYARFRNDAEADTGRMRRQQQVIRAMMQQGGKPDNWARMFKLADIIGEHVKTDVSPREWVRLVMSYAYNQPDQIKTLKINGVNRISERDQLWYFFVEEAERQRVRSVLEQLRRGNG